MNQKLLTYGIIEIEKRKFHCSKYPIDKSNVDIDNIMIPNKVFFEKKVSSTLLIKKHFDD